jgi:endonuclease V-like protein UPF0215 family
VYFLFVKLIIVQGHFSVECLGRVLVRREFGVVKPEVRVLGVDDGVFTPHVQSLVPVVGVVFRGGYWLDGVMRTEVLVDGFDATAKIAAMIVGSPHFRQLRVVMLNGITFGGFNVVDMKALHATTRLPVIAVTREKPDLPLIREALEHLPASEARWRAVLNAGDIVEISTRNKREKVYLHAVGVSVADAERIVRLTSTRSNIPEALRVAHLVASGISRL